MCVCLLGGTLVTTPRGSAVQGLVGDKWERLVRFDTKFLGHSTTGRAAVLPMHRDLLIMDTKLRYLRDAEDARHGREVANFIDAYDYFRHPRSKSSRSPALPSLREHHGKNRNTRNPNRLSESSYSEVTGRP